MHSNMRTLWYNVIPLETTMLTLLKFQKIRKEKRYIYDRKLDLIWGAYRRIFVQSNIRGFKAKSFRYNIYSLNKNKKVPRRQIFSNEIFTEGTWKRQYHSVRAPLLTNKTENLVSLSDLTESPKLVYYPTYYCQN